MACHRIAALRNRRPADDRQSRHPTLDHARDPFSPFTGTGRKHRHSPPCGRSHAQRRYGGLSDSYVASRRAFQSTRCNALHLRRHLPARRSQIPGTAARSARYRSRRTPLGPQLRNCDARLPGLGLANRRSNDHGRRTGSRSHRADHRLRFHRLPACGDGSQRRKRGIPHLLLRRPDFPHARPVPAGESLLPKLRHTARRRHGENLHLLVRRSARAISHLYRRHFR